MPDELGQHRAALTELLLSIADDKLMLGHRNADWTGLAPILEEDIAFSALAQDDIAHAGALFDLLADWNDDDANRLAFGRQPDEYRCAALVTLSDEFDWAVALVRQFCCDHFDQLRLARLAASSLQPLADLAARMAREEALGVGHADQWIVRLSGATAEARQRVESALRIVLPLTPGLFEEPAGVAELEACGLYPGSTDQMHGQWCEMVSNVLEHAGLPATLPPRSGEAGGRRGRHPAEFPGLLDEMCEVYRSEPQAQW